MITKVPKRLLTDIYLGDEGPLAGYYAKRCPCLEDYDKYESCVIVQGPNGEFTLMHDRCSPVNIEDEDA